jgi:hypothetical protein
MGNFSLILGFLQDLSDIRRAAKEHTTTVTPFCAICPGGAGF